MKLDSKKVLFLITLGSILEYYDFGIFIYLAPFIGKSLIPASNAWLNLLLSYAIFAAGALFRPLGGVIFAHLGDTRGRKYTFVYTILMMALPTFLIACIPSASVIGMWATILLIVLRILQSLALGGELPGSVIFGYEASSPGRKAFNTSIVIMGTNIGLFVSSLVCTLLMKFHWNSRESWRIAFAIGGMLGLVSYLLRKALVETPTFLEYKQCLQQSTVPLKLLFQHHKKPLLQLIGIGFLFSSSIAVFTYYIPNYLTTFYHFPLEQLMKFNSYSILIFLVGSLCAGSFDQWLGKKFFLCLFIGIATASLLLFWNYGTLNINQIFLYHSLLLLAVGVLCGRFPVLVSSFFPVSVRFTGVAVVWNISIGIITGCTQMILTWLVQVTGIIWIPALYLSFFAVLALISLITIQPRQLVEYHD
ncbi:MAG: MHS family MFS transporter [Verrucomicrobia bacterium]|nr:MHS family MFS transporter [Verrucomicrobiota bacterium]